MIEQISKETGFAINVDGHFKWIVFTNIKGHEDISALNRYYGAYDDGSHKIRGILSRQHSTPPIAQKLQSEMLDLMSNLDTPQEIVEHYGELQAILKKWKARLIKGDVDPRDLVFRIRCGKSPENYTSNTVQALAARRYLHFGKYLKAGETMQFLVRNDRSRSIERVMLADEINGSCTFDRQWYVDYLDRVFLDLMESIIQQMNLQLPMMFRQDLKIVTTSLENFL